MKKKLITLLAFCIIATTSYSQTFNMRTYLNDYDYIAVQLSQETLGSQADPISSADAITNLVFTVRWLQSLGDVDVDIICTNYNITESGTRSTKDTYYYQSFSCSSPLTSPDDYVLGEYEDIALLEATLNSSSTSGTFEIAPSGWATSITLNVEWNTPNPPSIQYTPSLVTGACNNTPIPTIVYDLVWTGADGTYPTIWDLASNWETTCGSAGGVPNTGNNCVIPVIASGNYPILIAQVSGGWPPSHQPTCDFLRINSGASMSIDNEDFGSNQVLFTVNNNLSVYGVLTAIPNSQLTVTGETYIDAAECFVVQATADGVGSFIDNGTITYGASGTAKVQTYLTNSAGAGNLDIHQVGPTVDEENYAGGGTGSYLSAFAIDASTYAYEYNDGWQNISSNTFEVRTANGIGLSTTDNTAHTLEMTGALMTGSQSSPTLAYGASANNYELISNPYPSSVDFDALAATNSGVVDNHYWIYDPIANNYVERAGGVGAGSQYVQVGQGFFVETNHSGTFDFTNDERSHSTSAFRETIANILNIGIVGGLEGYRDDAIIRFADEATSGYDKDFEAAFWESQNSDATSLRSVAEGNLELAINALPTESLTSGMTSVPLNFSCGYNTEYTLSFFDIETFEIGTEIWLEDKQVGGDWVSVNDNPDYTFTATSDDLEDRFVIHFFGPTGVDEFGIENTIDIYSYHQHAFVRNNTNEVIKKINIYTLSGELLQDINSPDLKLNKYWVSDKIGYYVVRVITDKNVYTNKVFISK